MKYRLLRHMFRNLEISKALLIRIIDSMDADDNGRISMAEVAVALKVLWKRAMGKIKEKPSKIKTVD